MKLPKTPPTPFLPYIHRCIWLTTFLIPFIYCFILVNFLTVVVQSYYLFGRSDIVSNLKYCTFYLLSIYVFFLDIIMILGNAKTVEQYHLLKSMLGNVAITVPRHQKLLKLTILKANALLVCLSISAFICAFMNSYYWGLNVDDRLLILSVLHEHLVPPGINITSTHYIWVLLEFVVDSLLSKLLLYSLYASTLHTTIVSVSAPLYYIYGVSLQKVMLLTLMEFVVQFKHQCKRGPVQEKYVLDNLKLLARKLMENKRYYSIMFETSQLIYFLYICDGMVFAMVGILSCFPPYGYALLGIVNCSVFLFFLFFINDTAEGYTEYGEILNATVNDLPWYNWTVKSQKTYLLVLVQLSKPFKIVLLMWLVVSRDLFKKLSQILYPVFNFLYSTKR